MADRIRTRRAWSAQIGRQLDQAGAESEDHGVGAVPGLQLAQHRRHVRAYGLHPDHQPLRDRRVAQPLGHQLEHLELASGQRLPAVAVGTAEAEDQVADRRRIQQVLTGRDRADGVDQLVGGGPLQQDAAAPARIASST